MKSSKLSMFLLCTVFLLQACGTDTDIITDATANEVKIKEKQVINPIPENVDLTKPAAVDKTSEEETAKNKEEEANRIAEARKEADKRKEEEIAAQKSAERKAKRAKARKEAKEKKKPAIKFDEVTLEFGIIKPGDVIDHKFYFTNTGKADLVITKADVTCGCTTPSYPFVPIAPGERGFIGVTYDSTGKLGKQKPTVTLTTNAGTKKVYMDGYVISEMAKESKTEGGKK